MLLTVNVTSSVADGFVFW